MSATYLPIELSVFSVPILKKKIRVILFPVPPTPLQISIPS